MKSPVPIFLLTLFTLNTMQITSDDDKEQPVDRLNPDEKKALRAFIDSVPHSPKLVWADSEPACSWKGVTCDPDNKTVLYLRLPAKSFVGEIPNSTIGMLTNLRVLSLRINKLNGSIPSDFGNLTSLTRIALYNNSFSGQLPYIYFKVDLKSFNISSNMLNSSIPRSFSKFPKSAFSTNVFLCGKPFGPCPSSYPPPDQKKPEAKKNKKQEIVGISVGSGLLLLILMCCVQKKMYEQSRESRNLPSVALGAASKSGASTQGGKNDELVFFDEGIYGFDLDDLLKASAEVLGSGGFGVSYKQVVEEKKTTVVVKRLKGVVATEDEFRQTMEVLGRLNNKNVVRLRAYYYSKEEKLLVYDYVGDNCSLSALLHGSKHLGQTQLGWDHRMRIALDAAKGLEYLHVHGNVAHGNIKSSNILIGKESNNEAYVTDYGLNKLFGESSSLGNGYWAPEVLEAQNVTSESDVYSFGVLLLELLTGETPKQATSGKHSKWVESLASEEPKAMMFDMDLTRGHNIEEMVQLWRIAKDCVSIVPAQRPRMHEVVSMMEDMWLRPSSDDHSKGYDFTPSTDARDTPSTITP
ncbi:hypothetical protein R6Q57_029207 [Mikania cordata]